MNPLIAQRLVGLLLVACASFVLWHDRKKKKPVVTIEHEPAPQPPPAPAPAPADDPDPARPGAAA